VRRFESHGSGDEAPSRCSRGTRCINPYRPSALEVVVEVRDWSGLATKIGSELAFARREISDNSVILATIVEVEELPR
jgi:hypothetical protein